MFDPVDESVRVSFFFFLFWAFFGLGIGSGWPCFDVELFVYCGPTSDCFLFVCWTRSLMITLNPPQVQNQERL
jgi:hypothetical protein